MVRKFVEVDGRRGDNDFEIRAFGQNLFQIAQQKIDIKTTFVSLINNDSVVLI